MYNRYEVTIFARTTCFTLVTPLRMFALSVRIHLIESEKKTKKTPMQKRCDKHFLKRRGRMHVTLVADEKTKSSQSPFLLLLLLGT